MSTSDSSSTADVARRRPGARSRGAPPRHGAARGVVERGSEIQQARRPLSHGLAHRVEADAVRADRQRREVGPRRPERVERSQEGGALDERRVVAAQEERAHQRDRLLRAARDQHLALRGRQPPLLQVAGDRAAQRRGGPARCSRVPASPPASAAADPSRLASHAAPAAAAGTRRSGRSCPRGRQPREDRAPLHHHRRAGRRPLRHARGDGGRVAHPGAAALSALQPVLAAQQVVRLHDRGPAHRELPGQHALGGSRAPASISPARCPRAARPPGAGRAGRAARTIVRVGREGDSAS